MDSALSSTPLADSQVGDLHLGEIKQLSSNAMSKFHHKESKLRYSEKQEWIPTDDDLWQYALSGRVKHLPKRKAKEVRIFLSSTFTDMYVERNALFKFVYPRLQSYCRKRWDIDFKVVDMRWGIQSGASNDHSTGKLCMAELRNCQENSLGPNFVLLLGDRYGTRQLPSAIPESEFDVLMAELKILATQQADMDLLQKWYRCDTNPHPAQRRLQPIDTMGINQNVFSREIEPRLFRLLRSAADGCYKKKLIHSDVWHRYFWSVTDEEVYNGIVAAADPNNHCLCFTRRLSNINLKHDKAWRFIDVDSSGKVDAEAQSLREAMRGSVYSILDKENIADFTISWCDDGGTNEITHEDYVKEFCDSFYRRVVAMIDKAASKDDLMSQFSRSPLLSEVIEHGHQAMAKVDTFQGRDDILDRVKQYIIDGSRTPLIVHGGSGFGKTSILAVASVNVFEWLSDGTELIVVRRFLGTTPESTNVESMLRGVVAQVTRHCGVTLDPPHIEEPMQLLPKLFSQLPRNKQLVLFLDSLDQLSPVGNAHSLDWIPVELPNNVKLVISTLPEEHGILNVLTGRGYPKDAFPKVELLDESTCFELVKRWVASKQQSLTAHQEECLRKRFKRSFHNSPLYAKLISDILRQAPSYMDPDEFAKKCELLEDTKICILHILEELRKKHGATLVNTVFSLLHLSNQGLTENELLDILSLDDDVLNDVFQFHMPPLRRMPAVLWSRIRYDVAEYVVDRDANGGKVLAWYHRQFIEIGNSVFVEKNPSVEKLRLLMAEYFKGTWANGKLKPFVYTDAMVKKLQLPSNYGEADRLVPDQPAILGSGKPNLRKLSQLPFLLTKSGQIMEFLTEIAGSIQPLVGMMGAYPFSEVNDLLKSVTQKDIVDKNLYEAYSLIKKALLHCSASASVHPNSLGPLLAGRLLPFYGASALTDHLLDDIFSEGLSLNALLVRHNQLEGFGSRLIFELAAEHVGPIHDIVEIKYDGVSYVASISTKVILFDISRANMSMRYSPPLLDGDHFKVLSAPSEDRPEHFAASLVQVPQVHVFSVKRRELVGKFDCREAADCENFVISDMLAFAVDKVELIAVWGLAVHGVLVYSLQECALIYHHRQTSRILTVVRSRHNDLVLLQPQKFTALTMSCKTKEMQVTAAEQIQWYWPENVKFSAKCTTSTNFTAIATADGELFLWENIRHEGWRLTLDSPAHFLTVADHDLLACTERFVYSIDFLGSEPLVAWRIERLLDRAKYMRKNKVIGNRLGALNSLWIGRKGEGTQVLDVNNFTGHTEPVTGIVNNGVVVLTCSADGTLRGFVPFLKISKHIEELPKFDRFDLHMDFVRGKGEYAVTVSSKARQAAVWSLRSGKIVRRLFHDGAAELQEAVVSGQYIVIIDRAGLVFFWNIEDSRGQPFSTVDLPGFFQASERPDGDLVVVSPGAVTVLNVPSGSIVTKTLLQPERKLIGCSLGAADVVLLVDHDQPTIEMLLEKTVVQKRVTDIKCLQEFGISISGFCRHSHIIVLAFTHNVVFYNDERHDVLLKVPLKRAIVMEASSTAVAARSGMDVHLFDVHNGVTKLGNFSLSSVSDIVMLSADGLHCLVATASRLLLLYRVSDMTVVGKYSSYCDITCAAMAADNRHVLAGMSDTRLLTFLVVDKQCDSHMLRLEGILQKPTAERDIEQKRNMLEAAAEEVESKETKDLADMEPYPNINGIRIEPEDSDEHRSKNTAYADAVIKSMWTKNAIWGSAKNTYETLPVIIQG